MKIIVLCLCLGYVTGFEVYWNVPSQQCARYKIDFVGLLEQYGIIVNTGDQFRGDKVSVFYDTQLGIYPQLVNYITPKNGGIPQRVDMQKHLELAEMDLEKALPSEDFHGPGVIDWEAWRPLWDNNFGKLRAYHQESIRYAQERHNGATNLTEIAKEEWETSAKEYFLETLRLAKKTRPRGVWGFWGFPECYNYEGSKRSDFVCPERVRNGNDRLSWLFEESTAVFPSVYADQTHLTRYTFEERSWRDDAILRETLRVVSPKSKIYPYVNFHQDEFLPKEDIERQIAQSATAGSDGAIIWGSSSIVRSKDHCFALKDFIVSTIGPASEKVAYRSDLCSKEVCNARGRCVFPKDDEVQKWKLFLSDKENFYAGDVECRCSGNYTGRFCEKGI